jgi:hypothetical protein
VPVDSQLTGTGPMIYAEVVELTPSWHENQVLSKTLTTGARSRYVTSRLAFGSMAFRGRNDGADGR